MRRLLLPLLAFLLLPGDGSAQRVVAPRGDALALRLPLADYPSPALERTSAERNTAALAVVASGIAPGAGQWLQGQRRWVPYAALEVWSWLRFRERRHESRVLADRYRDLAWRVARRVSVGERRDSIFEYYEAMTHFQASGAFDTSPFQDGVQPERDAGTFNGDIWALSRALHFAPGQEPTPGTPQYEAALAYYEAHAIPAAYAWAWGASNLEQQVFVDLISDSDDAYRDGTRMLGLILANHIASAVDALVTARLRALGAHDAELRTEPDPSDPARVRTSLRVHF